MGGEKYLPCFNADGFVGSPPRWRGKAVKFRCTCGLQRITPAWAGKSRSGVTMDLISRDHPRVGGEKCPERLKTPSARGSPPRGRGKATKPYVFDLKTGITPAWAGKSTGGLHHDQRREDHPRVGGEKTVTRWKRSPPKGSPPRGRGKDTTAMMLPIPARITPAWAGKSCSDPATLQFLWDHPRVGGEKTKKIP